MNTVTTYTAAQLADSTAIMMEIMKLHKEEERLLNLAAACDASKGSPFYPDMHLDAPNIRLLAAKVSARADALLAEAVA